jgi:hypothetical protein
MTINIRLDYTGKKGRLPNEENALGKHSSAPYLGP